MAHTGSHLRELFLLRPDVVFLNHGSFGACPRPVFEEYQRWQRELEGQPVEFLGRRFKELMQSAREALGAYVHARADDLVFVPNATTGLNIVARSLPLEPGDEVLATDHEYGALDRTWRFVCAQRGARYVNQPVPTPFVSPEDVVEAVWSGVTPRTRVLFLSHLTSPTALIFPVAELVRRARGRGLWTVIDGAHVPGQLALDLSSLEADFYAGNCHKWLCAPKGAAFLYARREIQSFLDPLVVSWGWNRDTQTSGGPETSEVSDVAGPGGLLDLGESTSRFIDEQEWTGTRDPAACLAVPAAIQFQAEHDWPRVRAECQELLREARRRIEEYGRGIAATMPPPISTRPAMPRPYEPICADSPEWYMQMAAFPLPACDGAALQRRLYDEFRIEVPIIEWNGRQLVRVSVQGYNTEEDLDALIRALADLLPKVS